MLQERYVYWLNELGKEDNELVGKKCANLGELSRIGVRVPPGFAISIPAWVRFIQLTGIGDTIRRFFEKSITELHMPQKGQKLCEEVRSLIETQEMPAEISEPIGIHYKRLCQETDQDDVAVAVRSAGAVSMPGAMETYLNVKGEAELLKKVLKVWGSAYTYRAVLYRHNHNLNLDYAPIGVAVLQLVEPKAAGVLMTANPTSGNTAEILLESNWELGESVVSGVMNPDRFSVSKKDLVITSKVVNRKLKKVVPAAEGVELVDIPFELQERCSISDDEVRELARVSLMIEQHFGEPTDVEWAYSANRPFPENLYFLQARPMKPLPKYKDAIDKVLDMMMAG